MNLTTMWNFARNLRINRGVLWLKIGYSLFGLGLIIVLPFVPLQMSALGLSDEDISLILGLMPVVTIFTLPLFGKLNSFNKTEICSFSPYPREI
jgi:MFS family permease